VTVAARLPLSEPGALGLLSPEPPVPALVSARGAFGSLRPVEVQRQRRGQLLRPLVTLRHAAWEARSADAFHSAVARVHTLHRRLRAAPAPAGRATGVATAAATGDAPRLSLQAELKAALRAMQRVRARVAQSIAAVRGSLGGAAPVSPAPRPAPPRPAPPRPAPPRPAPHYTVAAPR
jgi:hypothetical protein